MPSFRSLDDADVKGKRVLVRVDLNVPMQDGKVADSTRIEEIVPTIRELADKGGKIILLSHFDRPKGPDPKYSLRPVAVEVARLVKRPVGFAEDCIGPKAETAIAAMKNGDILCLENTRFHRGEEKNDRDFAKKLAALGDIFVNDAFSAAHREHASTTSIVTESKLPAYPGRAMKAELDALEHALRTAATSGDGHRRRRQSLHQTRPSRQSAHQGRDADYRRRHGQHVFGRPRQVGRQIAVRKRTGRRGARDHRPSQIARPRNRASGRCRGGGATCHPRSLARRRGRSSRCQTR